MHIFVKLYVKQTFFFVVETDYNYFLVAQITCN